MKARGFTVAPHGRCGMRAATTVISGFGGIVNALLSEGVKKAKETKQEEQVAASADAAAEPDPSASGVSEWQAKLDAKDAEMADMRVGYELRLAGAPRFNVSGTLSRVLRVVSRLLV